MKVYAKQKHGVIEFYYSADEADAHIAQLEAEIERLREEVEQLQFVIRDIAEKHW